MLSWQNKAALSCLQPGYHDFMLPSISRIRLTVFRFHILLFLGEKRGSHLATILSFSKSCIEQLRLKKLQFEWCQRQKYLRSESLMIKSVTALAVEIRNNKEIRWDYFHDIFWKRSESTSQSIPLKGV